MESAVFVILNKLYTDPFWVFLIPFIPLCTPTTHFPNLFGCSVLKTPFKKKHQDGFLHPSPPIPSPVSPGCLAWIRRSHWCFNAAQIAIQGAEVHLFPPGGVSEVRENPGDSGNPKGDPATRSGTQVAQVPQGIEGIEGLQCFIFIQRCLKL